MKWYLIIQLWTANCTGNDCCIRMGACGNVEHRIEMPSLDICRQVRAVNQNSKCISEAVD